MEIAIVFLPLLAAIIAGFLGRLIGDRGAQLVTCGALVLSALLAVIVFFQAIGEPARSINLMPWIVSGSLEAYWALRIDALSAVMLVVVTVVSSIVHIYSAGYMSHDKSIPRFMAYLSLFTFFMLMLVTADNLLQMFFGWEGVGLASYLLIGFWYEKPSACAAAMKAFIVNRVGDFGYILGIAAIFLLFDSVSFDVIFSNAADKKDALFVLFGQAVHALDLICILLFIGAMGKSAQLGLHTWLPDAMEGPTPVSALIHAATMVTAGVFLVARMSPLFEYAPTALAMVTIVGASTAFFAATIGLVQNDIKRVIAYSTCSQLGYMFFACGVSAYAAGIFHLFTHAFFKALLFLAAGSVIHGLSGEQDMRKMGGIWRLLPITYAFMWIGNLALAGIPPFAGFFSKDIVLESAWAAHSAVGAYAFWLGIAAAFMTAFYSWRLLFMTFHGQPRASHEVMEHAHESPPIMWGPLTILALGAITAGLFGYSAFVGEASAGFWAGAIHVLPEHNVLEAAHHAPFWVKALPLLMGIGGIALAYLFYIRRPDLPGRFAQIFSPLYRFFLNKWYFDELYDFLFVRSAKWLGRQFWQKGDGMIIDGFGPNGIAAFCQRVGDRARALQTGYLYHYAFAMLIGVVVFLTWYLSGFGFVIWRSW
ncbi:MAG: NADH-quinone oxidoreductase subunit L [Dongiaceae bacterium]